MARVLGAVRLSDVTDETTSPERQAGHITDYANYKRHEIIHIARDVDVSGAVSPFDRAGLGPWLKSPRLDDWDALVVAKLDRLTRSILDFETLWKFLDASGKTMVSVAEDMDFGTPAGRLMARQLVMFAEYEREIIRSRIKDAYDALQHRGQYPGMQFPFGYMPKRLEPKGWGLIPHPVYGATLAEIVERLITGESLGSLCRWLENEGIPTPRNMVREYGNEARLRDGKPGKPLADAHWKPTSLTKILQSEAILGAAMSGGKPLRDEYGRIVYRSEPLIDRGKWEQVKRILAVNAARQGPRLNASPLLQIAFCLFCKSPLYITKTTSAGTEYRYYICRKANRGPAECEARRIPADMLETWLEEHLLAEVGEEMLTEVTTKEGSDNRTEMAELAEAIGNLAGQIALTKATGGDASGLEAKQDVNSRKLAELADIPATPPEVVERETGETWAQRWARDPGQRNAYMRKRGVRIEAARRADGKYQFKLWSGWREVTSVDDEGIPQAHGEYVEQGWLSDEEIQRQSAREAASEAQEATLQIFNA